MIWTNVVLFCVFTAGLILYCVYFKEKSLHFGLCVAWLGVNIVLSATFIVYKSNLFAIPITQTSEFDIIEFAIFFSKLIDFLRCINFILFFFIIFSFYSRKKKEENNDLS